MNIENVTVTIRKGKGYYDFFVEDTWLGWSQSRGTGKGYSFFPLKLQCGELKQLAESMYVNGGLTLAEVKAKANILAGIYLASKSLEKEEVGMSEAKPTRIITQGDGSTVRQYEIGYKTRASFADRSLDRFWIRQGGLGADGTCVGLDQEALEGLIEALRAEGLI